MRIRGIPFTEDVGKFIESHEQNFVVEMNRDGQMYQILLVEYPHLAGKLTSAAFNDGLPATAKWIKDSILVKEAN
jgi:2-oxoglutarate ferredoxin oxidoreductase subunit alpha